MNVFALDVKCVDLENIYFLETKKNMIMNGMFTKLIYTTENYTMNGLYIYLPVETLSPTRWVYQNAAFMIEKQILEMYSKLNTARSKKTPSYGLSNYFPVKSYNTIDSFLFTPLRAQSASPHSPAPEGNISAQRCKNEKKMTKHYMLKISGIWETASDYGITYKIIETDHQSFIVNSGRQCTTNNIYMTLSTV